MNPSGYAPLTAGIPVTAGQLLIVTVRIESAYEGQEDLVSEFQVEPSPERQWIPVIGLYPDYKNIVHLSIKSSDGTEILEARRTLTTRPSFEELPSKAETDGLYPESGEMIFVSCSLRGLFNLQQAVAFDRYGNLRWYSQFPHGYHPIEIIDGNVVAGDHTYKNMVHRINMLGFTERSSKFGTEENGYIYIHHDLVHIGGQHYLLTVNNTKQNSRENMIIEFDFNEERVVKSWDLEEILPNVDDLYADLPNTYYMDKAGKTIKDTLHINALDFNPETREILVTSQRFGAALISYDGELLWIMAPHNLRRRNTEPGYDPQQFSSRKENINMPSWPPVHDGTMLPGLPAYSFLAEFSSEDPKTWRQPVSGRIPAFVPEGEDWNYDEFLLDPVIPGAEKLLPERLLESGQDIIVGGQTLFAWPFRPHTARFLSNGDIVIFDNGFSRNFIPFVTKKSFSRAVIYRLERSLDGYGGRVRQIWEYKLEDNWKGFSLFLGETEELENGNILIDFGGLGKADNVLKYFNPDIDPSILINDFPSYLTDVEENVVIVEVEPRPDGSTKEIFRLSFKASEKGTVGSYRASKFNLYDAWMKD
ncbi:MAG: aryl-sulfate sulfotransferase [Spirochaetales bacterium]|nr:aryl-sulfate sulfotransferase [Spirochaetales bacterium]